MSWWRFWSAFRPPRGVGHTYILGAIARSQKGMVVVRDEAEAQRVKRQHGTDAASINNGADVWGKQGPIFVDIDALIVGAQAVAQYEHDIVQALLPIITAFETFARQAPSGVNPEGVYLWKQDGGACITLADVRNVLRALDKVR